MGRLDGKVALVTGASKGIGASIAQHLAIEGASVAVNYSTSKGPADALVDGIIAVGGSAVAIGANVSQPDAIRTLISETVKAFGRIDVLVNNAAIYEFAPIEKITPANFRKHFDLNVLGLLLVTQAAIEHFPQTGGSIINISSVASVGSPNASVYSGTKGAVNTISVSLARELGPRNIRVNSVSPGLVVTEGAVELLKTDMEERMLKRTPLGRVGYPDDIARVVVFLASDESFWVSGENIRAAGGMH